MIGSVLTENKKIRKRIELDMITDRSGIAMDNDLIFESFRNCITDKKCKGCEWTACKILQNRRVGIPVDLGLAVTALMADLLKEREFVKCGDCIFYDSYCQQCGNPDGIVDGIILPDWYCADGVKRDE